MTRCGQRTRGGKSCIWSREMFNPRFTTNRSCRHQCACAIETSKRDPLTFRSSALKILTPSLHKPPPVLRRAASRHVLPRARKHQNACILPIYVDSNHPTNLVPMLCSPAIGTIAYDQPPKNSHHHITTTTTPSTVLDMLNAQTMFTKAHPSHIERKLSAQHKTISCAA